MKTTYKTFSHQTKELFDFVKCSYEEERLPLSKQFWKTYEKIKTYKPQYKSTNIDNSLEQRALNSLKTISKYKKDELDQRLISFIDTLIKDIKKYKTLPKFTLRKLVLQENAGKKSYDELIKNIEGVRRKLGNDYLEVILKRSAKIDDDIIIAVENKR